MIKATRMLNAQQVSRAWHIIDADGQILGRLASQVATILRGKHKPTFTSHVDTGDCVVVVNASKIRLTGDKLNQKTYYRHSGYRGGLKAVLARHLMEKEPEEVIRKAVVGMLPKTPLGHAMVKKLHVYAGPTHPHRAQGPVARPLRWTARAAS